MAEAMIPRDVRDAIINKPTCDENENNSTSSMRKKRNNSVVIAIPAEIKRRKISQGSVPSDESIRNILSGALLYKSSILTVNDDLILMI